MTMRMSIPIEKRQTPRTIPQGFCGWLRLFLIELRRSSALWAALLIAAMTTFIMWDSLLVGVVRWRDLNNSAVEVPPIYASAIIGAFAAWQAGTIRQRHLLDQIGITTFPGTFRDLASILSVAVWGIAGYIVPVAGFYTYGAMNATWGGPDLGRPLLASATILAASAFGWLTGTLVRHRIAPLVSVVLLLVLFFADDFTRNLRKVTVPTGPDSWRTDIQDGWWHHLVPNNVLTATYAGEIAFHAIGWMLGLAAVFWLIDVAVNQRSRATMFALCAVLLLTTGFAASVVAFEPESRYGGSRIAISDLRCASRLDDRITICVHPENATLLDVAADEVASVVEPLSRVPGTPALFIEGVSEDAYDHDGVPFHFKDMTTIADDQMQVMLMHDVVRSQRDETTALPFLSSAQFIVSEWLATDAGIDRRLYIGDDIAPLFFEVDRARSLGMTFDEYSRQYYGEPRDQATMDREEADRREYSRKFHDAIRRFASMPDAERTAWLSANWDALIAGELTLEDLP